MPKKKSENIKEYSPEKPAKASRVAVACIKIPLVDLERGKETLSSLIEQACKDNPQICKMRGALRLY